MKFVKISAVVLGLILLFSFLLFKDFEFERDPTWPENLRVYANPLTNRIRVVDADDGATLFYYAADPQARPVRFKKIDGVWLVTFAKRSDDTAEEGSIETAIFTLNGTEDCVRE